MDFILYREVEHLAVFTLNRPEVLNTLNLEMIVFLKEKLKSVFQDPKISYILIQGSGEKSFCAGGDVKTIAQKILAQPNSSMSYKEGDLFFEEEYELNFLMHHSPKPILTLANGITMGGGVGLLAGSQIRIITSTTQLAMPEVFIGFFPDVGSSFFLRKAPGQLGLFIALTGIRITGSDALFTQLGNIFISHEKCLELIPFLIQLSPNLIPNELLKKIQKRFGKTLDLPIGPLQISFSQIETALSKKNITISSLCNNSELKSFTSSLEKASHNSFQKILEHWDKTKGMSLQETLNEDLVLAQRMIRHPDFSEGVRSILIDKNQNPKWID